MRQTELSSGVDLRDDKGRRVCKSTYAARKGIGQVTDLFTMFSNTYTVVII